MDTVGDNELAPGVFVPPGVIRLQFARGSGPGGQNVNKVNTKAELWIAISAIQGLNAGARQRLAVLAGSRLTLNGEIHLACDIHRSQESNRAEVFDRLRKLIVAARHEPKRRRKTKPTFASKQRRLESKKRQSKIKGSRRRPE